MTTRKTKQQVKKAGASDALSKVDMTFEGMMILFVSQGSPYCDVAILKYAPNHMASILITRTPTFGAPESLLHLHGDEFEPRMWFDVEAWEAGITLYQDDLTRFDRANNLRNEKD